jgi:hypothetical protein
MYNYNNKVFKSICNTLNGEVGLETTFYYKQKGNIVTATYSGGNILQGNLIALVNNNGVLNMHYHHINNQQQIMTGICISTPELMPNNKIRLSEKWQWTNGDKSSGESIIEEV